MRRIFDGIFALSLLLASALPASAQTFGQITGQVTDASGAILVGASVTVTNTQTNQMREAVTNTSGSYAFPTLLPGVYNVKVDLQGFQSKVRSGVELQVQQTARLDFSLELGSVEVAVEVTGSAPMINATDATVGTVIENKQILELPLNGRNFINLVSLSPNVSSDWAGGGGGGASTRQGGDRSTQNFAVAGQRREYNQYTLDGIVNQDVNFNTYAFLPSIDSVEEFKVQTGVYSAEFGREVAQVNVSTKSGTNAYHGTIFEFIRNDAFDAAPYAFTNVTPANITVQVESVRLYAGRADQDSRVVQRREQVVLHVQLRRVPAPQPAGGRVQHAECRDAQRRLLGGRRDDQRSADRPAVPWQHHSDEPVGPHRHQAAGVLSRAEYSGRRHCPETTSRCSTT